tara:strand:- start:540 stop:1331 length:792 start_codon:yes stop_codon:yes gene_type:complete
MAGNVLELSLDSNFGLIPDKDIFKYYSQDYNNGEKPIDKLVLDKYINYWKDKNKKDNITGVFVEVGAYNGITYSNTKTMEDHLNWTGVLIEPSPQSFQKLKTVRPDCRNYQCAISNSEEKTLSFTGDDSAVGGLTGVLETMTQKNGRNWIEAWSQVGQLSLDKIEVPIRKLSDVLDDANIKYIDFLSIDVEGSELQVLETMNWDIPVYVIVFEISAWGSKGKEMVENCRKLLTEKGFKIAEKLQLDEIWVNDDYFRKDLLIQK